MSEEPEIKPGDKCLVEIWNSADQKSTWHKATYISKQVALDRDYRISVVLDNGTEINECAPECIKPLDHE